MPTNPSPFSPAANRATSSAAGNDTTAAPNSPSRAPLPIQFTQITKSDIDDPTRLNVMFAQWATQINALLGAGGPSRLVAGVDVAGAQVTGLGAPTSPTSAVSQSHVQSNYGGQTLSPQLDIGGQYALKGLTGVTIQQNATQATVAQITAPYVTGSNMTTLPSGLIEQWGHATAPGTITFPTPFPTGCLNVVATDDHASGTAGRASIVGTPSATSFQLADDQGGNGAWWRAIGN